MSLSRILDGLASYLEFQIEEGTRILELPAARAAAVRGVAAPRPAAGGAVAAVAPPRRPPAPSPAPTPAPAPAPAPARTTRPAAPLPDAADLDAVARAVAACRRCALHETRTRTVPGQGAPAPEILFVGEAPGEDEDRAGLAFVGAAGQLLSRMIEAMGCRREDVFIANILKCRPPGNRTPLPEEMEACLPYLKTQIALLKPKVIVALGAVAFHGLTGLSMGITRARGRWLSFEGVPLMPTYHPAYLLRQPSAKKEVWEDLQAVLRHLGRTPPPTAKRKNPGPAEA